MAGNVIGDRRLFEPDQVEGRQGAGSADRLVSRPLHVRVDHQREVVAEVLAHVADALDVLPNIGSTDLHLDGPNPRARNSSACASSWAIGNSRSTPPA